METVAEHQVSVILSSHLVADVERACGYLVILVSSKTNLKVSDVMAVAMRPRCTSHRRVGFEIVISRGQRCDAALVKFIWRSPHDRKIMRSTYPSGKTLMRSFDVRLCSRMFVMRVSDQMPMTNIRSAKAREPLSDTFTRRSRRIVTSTDTEKSIVSPLELSGDSR